MPGWVQLSVSTQCHEVYNKQRATETNQFHPADDQMVLIATTWPALITRTVRAA